MMASGRVPATAARTAALSSTSSARGSAPSDRSRSALLADREVAVTWWPPADQLGEEPAADRSAAAYDENSHVVFRPSVLPSAVTPGGVAVSLLLTRDKKGT